MPLLYAGGYEYAFLNQNTATVNVYNNGGRVLINQAGVEMGNGCQVNIQVNSCGQHMWLLRSTAIA